MTTSSPLIPEASSPLTSLAAGPSDLKSARLIRRLFLALQHRSSSGPVHCRHPVSALKRANFSALLQMPQPRVWLVGILHDAEEQCTQSLRAHRDGMLVQSISLALLLSLTAFYEGSSALPFLFSQQSSENETSEPRS